MKKIKLISVFALLFMLNVASTCSNDDDSPSISADPTPVINTVNTGNWIVTLYNDSGVVKTTDFANYIFTFGPNNILSAVNGGTTVTGTWSVTSDDSNDDSNDDSPSNDLDFNIAFSAPTNFAELTEDWNIISYTATKVELIHVSGGNGGTDYITFEKN